MLEPTTTAPLETTGHTLSASLAESIGKKIRWERIDQGRMIDVSRWSFSGDNKPLAEMLQDITGKLPGVRKGKCIG